MDIYSIYKITNTINNKCYIGWTSKMPTERFKQHTRTKTSSRSTVSYAIEKYGVENFVFEVLYQSTDYEHSRASESLFIKEYNSLVEDLNGWGYNIDSGGTGHKRSKMTIEKHRKSVAGIPKSDEHKKNISKSISGVNNGMYGKIGKLHPQYGIPKSEEHKKRVSETKIANNKKRKENGTYIKPITSTFESVIKMKETKLKNRGLNGKYKNLIIQEPDGKYVALKDASEYIDYFNRNVLNNFMAKSIKQPGIEIKGFVLVKYDLNV